MFRKIKYYVNRKYNQVRNIFRWIPVLWNQFDFDYTYSLAVFKHQLNKQAIFFEKHGNTLSAPYQAKRIRTTLRLMEKVYSDTYSMEYCDKVEEKYGEGVMEAIITDSRIKYKFEDLPNSEEITKYKDKCFKECQLKQERAHRILWKMVEYNIRNWWD